MTETLLFLKKQKLRVGRQLQIATALSVTGGLFLVLQAWCLANIIGGVTTAQMDLTQTLPWVGTMLLSVFLRAILNYFAEETAFEAALRVKQALREQLISQIQRLGPASISDRNSGELSTLLSDNIDGIEQYYSKYLPAMSTAALIPLSILVFVFPQDWVSALILLLSAPLIPFFMVLIGRGAEKLNQQHWRELSRMSGHFLDTIQGLTTLKLFNASRREARLIADISEAYRLSTMKVLRVAFITALALEFFATVSIALVAITIGFKLLHGAFDFTSAFFYTTFSSRILPAIAFTGHTLSRSHDSGWSR